MNVGQNYASERVLIVSAHPDDDIIGCGGIISKFRQEARFKVIFICEGSTCRFSYPGSSEAQEALKERTECAKESLKYLGVSEYEFYDLLCGRLDQEPQIKINKIIEKEISLFKPDTVFTHSNVDSNKDHSKVYDATIIATRPESFVKDVYSYEVLSSSEWGFNQPFSPNVFFELSEQDVANKWRALEFYKTEIRDRPHPRSKEGVFSLAKVRGAQSGFAFAESFKLIRSFR